jgi:hypothetical protein
MVIWPHCCRPVERQNIMAGRVWQSKATHLMVAGKQREKGTGNKIYPSKHAPSELLPTTRFHLLHSPFSYEHNSGLT